MCPIYCDKPENPVNSSTLVLPVSFSNFVLPVNNQNVDSD